MSNWTPTSWKQHPVTQAVIYPNLTNLNESINDVDPEIWKRKKGLDEVIIKLESLPPLVSAVEVSLRLLELF